MKQVSVAFLVMHIIYHRPSLHQVFYNNLRKYKKYLNSNIVNPIHPRIKNYYVGGSERKSQLFFIKSFNTLNKFKNIQLI